MTDTTTKTTKAAARARLLKERAAAAAERAEKERKNVTDLTEFLVRTGEHDGVDDWLAERVKRVEAEADERRRKHRLAAARALAAMRSRDESVASIAEQAGITSAKVREYLKLADADGRGVKADKPKVAKAAGCSTPAAPEGGSQDGQDVPAGVSPPLHEHAGVE